MIKILTGPAINGHIFRDHAEAVAKALPILVGCYADATGLDVHHAEAVLVEVRVVDKRTGKASDDATVEVRVGGTTIASWREEPVYPAHVAREVAAIRPDLCGDDAVAAILTADPALTAQEVIDALDEATEDYAADREHEAKQR